MKKNSTIAVIGLGKFGLRFAEEMMRFEYEVLGVDKSAERIKRAQNQLTQVFQAEIADKNSLLQMGFGELSLAMVSVGDSITASTMISMHLMDIEVKHIWVKAVNPDHARLLHRIGLENVIIPESLAAAQLAKKIVMPGFIDIMPFDPKMMIQELSVQKWAGKNLKQLDLTNNYEIQVIAVKAAHASGFQYIPKANQVLNEGDHLIVIGPAVTLSDIAS